MDSTRMSKRTLILALLAAAIFLTIGGLLYYFLADDSTPTPTVPSETPDDLFPFGDEAGALENKPIGAFPTTFTGTNEGRRYVLISKEPVAGSIWVASTTKYTITNEADETETVTESVDALRYIERATGHVYDTALKPLQTTRISNITLPKIYQALWADSEHVVLRRLDDSGRRIETLSGLLVDDTTDSLRHPLTTTPLPVDISQIAVSPSGKQIFYLQADPGGSQGFIAALDGSAVKQIWNSPISELLASWTGPEITLVTKPSGIASGYAYAVKPAGGVVAKLISNTKGLTVLTNSDGSRALYSVVNAGKLELHLLDTTTGETRWLPMTTLPEKCVWSTVDTNIVYCAVPQSLPSGTFPDDWYQGQIHTNDIIIRIDTNSYATDQVLNPADYGQVSIDATSLALSPDETRLSFIDHTNQSLWSIDLVSFTY
jgi:hypothetical protein